MPVTLIKRWLTAAILVAVSIGAGAGDMSGQRTTREDLIGAWRLVRINVTGPQGPEEDPFYGTGSQGLLIYDPAGWFSVQIMGAQRPLLDVPKARPEQANAARQTLRAQALDSYYAYYGAWTFDPASSTVTHHADGALYPSEEGATYAQHVEVHGSTMTFTCSQGPPDHRTVQTKVWERAKAR